MKRISLTKGKFTLVDDDDFDELNLYSWHYTSHGYAARRITIYRNKSKIIYMHRLILPTPNGFKTDHINSNKLDNRRSNLRICTNKQNQMNLKTPKTNKSGFKGVYWHKKNQRWAAQIGVDGKLIYLGGYDDKLDAAKAYDNAAIKYFGEFAKCNLK